MHHGLLLISFLFLSACNESSKPEFSAIAHAGGGIHNKRYTNSIQALDYNYQRGFELFEIDFVWTTDKTLVCLHDWDRTPKWLLNYHGEKPLSKAEFNALKNEEFELKPCDLITLNQWLIDHPKAYVVTDIKGRNVEGLKLMLSSIDEAIDRVIPQFTQPEDYELVKDLGYKHLIWTLYSYKGSDKSVVKNAVNMNLFAVPMPPHRAKKGLAKLLPKAIPTYVHTINSLDEAEEYKSKYGLTSVYTDFLEIDF